MKLNIEATRNLLQAFDFQTLFREELGWNNPSLKTLTPFQTKEGLFYRKAIADLSGATVFEISSEDGIIPNASIRQLISLEIQKLNFVHILVFIDKDRSQSIWRWIKKQEKKNLPREHFFSAGQTGDAFIPKLANLMVDLSEIESDITITDVSKKIQLSLDVQEITKSFFKDYQQQFVEFLPLIGGIDDENDKRWYASVILNRLMFIYFLQQKGFIDKGKLDYLYFKLTETQSKYGDNKYYDVFLKTLFFEGFAKPGTERSDFANELLGNIKYLNGGLFLKHKIEEKYPGITIPDIAFINLLKSDEPKGLFEQFSWSLDDTPGGKDDEINPDVLGYIFEKYINQKAFGAYYTRTEITEYLCEQTVYKLIIDEVNGPIIAEDLLKKAGLDKLPKDKHFNTIEELLIGLDSKTCTKLLIGENAILPNLSLLDPACGSGAFLVAAMKTLINVYSAIIGRITFLNDAKLTEWKTKTEKEHPSINYYIKKQIITNNLYGVDIMEEAIEIAKLRLFLALVSSANKVDHLEPLPNIDFNIMSGNSLIGMMRVDPDKFNTHYNNTSKAPAGKVVRKESLFEAALIQGNMFSESHSKSYQQLINEKEAAITAYKKAQHLGYDDLQALRNKIQENEGKASKILNQLLVEEFQSLSIPYSECTWDDEKQKESKLIKRPIKKQDIEGLEPFHWGYEFSNIFKKGGFDAIIANPPWEIFKPTSKEFFKQFTNSKIKRKMPIEEFNNLKNELLKNELIQQKWIQYLNKFPYESDYYKKSQNFSHQTSIIDGKKNGSDINLYKLFLEQSFNLLKKDGRCGIIVPSGIYLDIGNLNLRKLLFDETEVQNLYALSNEKFLFEEVEHNIKYALLSFKKGNNTTNFNVCFRINPREAVGVKDLDGFFHDSSKDISLTIEDIEKVSPISLAIPEFKNILELKLLIKLTQYPILGNKKLKFTNEFHMTSNSNLFENKKVNDTFFPLIEGKIIHQYQYLYSKPRYWVSNILGRKALIGQSKDDNQPLSYQQYRISFRAIARATDSRTMISTILPPNSFSSNSLAINMNFSSNKEQLVYVGVFNSYVLDFILRSRISSNLNFFYVYNLPIPDLTSIGIAYQEILVRVAKLICTSEEFATLWEEVMPSKWSLNVVEQTEKERSQSRAELDGIIANIYGLTEEEFVYILSTFPVVSSVQKEMAFTEFKKLQPQFLAEDEIKSHILVLIAKGESPKTEFKSTLRVDLKTNKAEKFIEHSVLKTLVAFLNSGGGTLLIGVADDKTILGLNTDFNSFSKADKLDEFQKHFDNLIQKSIGNRFQRYLDITFPTIEGKVICSINIKEKSTEPVYLTDDSGNEKFYIRRQASTIDLKPSEANKYIKEHWG